MEERIKALRKELGLTQQEFADRMGVKRNTVATYEMGRSRPSDSAISLICKTFNVNEEWLCTGEGEMFAETNDTILSELAAEYNLEGEQLMMMRGFLMLTSEQRTAILKAALLVAEANKKAAAEAAKKEAAAAAEEKPTPPAEPSEPPAASNSDTPDIPEDPEIEAEIEKIRARLYARKKTRETLTGLPFSAPFGTKKDPPR